MIVRDRVTPRRKTERTVRLSRALQGQTIADWMAPFVKLYLPFIILVISIAALYHDWFSGGAISWSDWKFQPAARLHDYWLIPSLWDGAIGTGGTNLLGATMLPLLSIEALLGHFGVDATINTRLVWIFPPLLAAAFATYALAIEFFASRIAGIISALFVVSNTYVAIILTGGQLTVSGGYLLVPAALLFCYRALCKPVPSRLVLPALILAIQVMYDLRATYITMGTLTLFALFYIFAQPSFHRSLCALGSAVVQLIVIMAVIFLVNIFWLMPVHYAQGSGGVSLPSGYNDLFWVHVLSYMHLSHAFALYHPFWYQNSSSPSPNEVDPLYFLLPLPIFALLLKKRLTYIELFLFATAILGIFLVKGSNLPGGSVFEWMFLHFPGFDAYRDPSKFYQPLAVAYALLLGRAAASVPMSKVTARTGMGFLRKAVCGLVPVACLGLILLQAVPVAAHPWGALTPQPLPAEYVALNHFIDRQPQYFRVMWHPTDPYGSFSANHPSVGLGDVGNDFLSKQLPNRSDANSWVFLPQAKAVLAALSVKYIVVADDAANTPLQWRSNKAQALALVHRAFPSFKELRFGGAHVFENPSYVPEVFVPAPAVTSAIVLAALHHKLTPQQPMIRHLGVIGDYATGCRTCLTLASQTLTRKEVIVRHITHPFLLIFNQNYDPNWAAYLEPTSSPQPFWWTWTHHELPPSYHLRANGFANAWWITRPGTYRIVIEYWPQRLTAIGWIVAWLTMIGCLVIAITPFIIRRAHDRKAITHQSTTGLSLAGAMRTWRSLGISRKDIWYIARGGL